MSISPLDIAQTGLDAAQTGLDTVSQNLANASVTGYVAQTADLGTLAGGPGPVGSGVQVDAVSLDTNPALLLLSQSTAASSGAASSLSQTLQGAESVFTDFPTSSTSSTSSSGLQSQLSTFWSDWASVANSPGSSAARTSLVGAAQSVTDTLQSMSSGLSSASQGAENQLTGLVGEINGQLSQMASLNKAVLATRGSSGDGANALREQQLSLATTLASEIGATNSTDATGSVTVQVGGTTLVSAAQAATLAVSGTPGSEQITASGGPLPGSPASSVSVSSGNVAGLLTSINTDLPAWSSQLDKVAQTLASSVNTQLESGVYWTPLGSSSATSHPGVAMFDAKGGGTITAANIGVASTVANDPALIAAGSTAAAGPLDGSNAQAVSNLAGSSSGADSIYQALVGQAGADTATATTQASVASQAASAASAQASAQMGVNSNNQLTMMLQYQQMFEASGKVVSTAASMFASLLASVP